MNNRPRLRLALGQGCRREQHPKIARHNSWAILTLFCSTRDGSVQAPRT